MKLTHKRGRVIARLTVSLLLVVGPAWANSDLDTSLDTFDCIISPSVVADIGSSAPGVLASVLVDRNDKVAVGQVIAELESGVEKAALKLARLRAEMNAEIELNRINLEFSQRNQKRNDELFKHEGISQYEKDRIETESKLADSQLRQAKDKRAILKSQLEIARQELDRRIIRSPIDGVVMELFGVEGEFVKDKPVARVALLDPLHVAVILPAEQMSQVQSGMSAEVWIDNVSTARWHAEVEQVDRVADAASGTYGVRLTLPNPDLVIPVGLRCQMKFVNSTRSPMANALDWNSWLTLDENKVNVLELASVESSTIPEISSTAIPPLLAAANAIDRSASSADSSRENLRLAEEMYLENWPEDHAGNGAIANSRIAQDAEAIAQAEAMYLENWPMDSASSTDAARTGNSLVNKSEASYLDNWPNDIDNGTIAPEHAESQPDDSTQDNAEVSSIATPESDETVKSHSATSGMSTDNRSEISSTLETTDYVACEVLGPFKSEMEARHVSRLKQEDGYKVQVRRDTAHIDAGFNVTSDVLPDYSAAKDLVRKLNAKGFFDVHLPRRQSKQLRVYLGNYKKKSNAQNRIDDLQKQGFVAELSPENIEVTLFFVAVQNAEAKEGDLQAVSKDSSSTNSEYCQQLASF